MQRLRDVLGTMGASIRRIAVWALSAILAGLLVGLVFLYLPPERDAQWLRWHISHGLSGTPLCDDPAWLRPIKVVRAFPYTYWRVLPDTSPYPEPHSGAAALDTNPDTAWIEHYPNGYTDSSGKPMDYIAFRFPSPTHVSLVCVRNGWTRDNGTYSDFARLKQIRLTSRTTCQYGVQWHFTNYVESAGATAAGMGFFDSKPISCRDENITLWIEDVYPGHGATRDLVAISDVEFYH